MVHRVVLVSILAAGSSSFLQNGFLPIVPFVASDGCVGLLLAMQGLVSCCALPIVGPIVDKVGSARVLVWGLAIQSVAIIFTGISSLRAIQGLGRVMQGIAGSTLFNASIAYIMDYFQEPERARHVGTVLGAYMVFGLLGAPLIGCMFSTAQTWNLPHPVTWALYPWLGLLVTSYMILSRGPRKVPMEATEESQLSVRLSFCERFFGVYLVVGRQAILLAMLLVCAFAVSGSLQCAAVLEMHARNVSPAIIGLAFCPNMLVQALASPWAGHVASTPKRRWVVLISGVGIQSLGLAIVGLLHGVIGPVVLAMVVCSMGLAFLDAPSISLMTDFASSYGRGNGEAVTASEMAVTLGNALGPLIGQWLLPVAGFGGLCLVLGVASLIIGILGACFLEQDGGSPALLHNMDEAGQI